MLYYVQERKEFIKDKKKEYVIEILSQLISNVAECSDVSKFECGEIGAEEKEVETKLDDVLNFLNGNSAFFHSPSNEIELSLKLFYKRSRVMERSDTGDFQMPRGKYIHVTLDCIPSDYLKWVAGEWDDEEVAEACDTEWQFREHTNTHWEDNR